MGMLKLVATQDIEYAINVQEKCLAHYQAIACSTTGTDNVKLVPSDEETI